MSDWSPHRRSLPRAIAVTATVGSAGCSTLVDSESNPVDLCVINETSSEVSTTLRYLL